MEGFERVAGWVRLGLYPEKECKTWESAFGPIGDTDPGSRFGICLCIRQVALHSLKGDSGSKDQVAAK